MGLNGIVIKSHGSADRFAFACALEEAVSEIENNVPAKISERVADVLNRMAEKKALDEEEK